MRYGEYSLQGSRSSQQDAAACEMSDSGILLAGVFDGMGGMEGGELASNEARQLIFQQFSLFPPTSAEAVSWLRGAITQADRHVASLKNTQGQPLGGGTTCVLILADEEGFYWASVGDSGIYLLRQGMFMGVNRLHNFNLQLGMMRDRGEIGEADAQRLGTKGEALISYLGIGNLPLLDTSAEKVAWMPGDIVILCSDGLYKSLNMEQIQAIVDESGGSMQLAAKRLCHEAARLCPGKQDNVTVITVGYGLSLEER